MDALTLSFFITLEMVLLLGVASVVLWRRYQSVQRQLHAQSQAPPDDETFASITSGYLPYLEQEILATRSRLELSATESGGDATLPAALQQRLTALEAEKRVAESCNDYPERQWEFVAEYFQPEVDEPAGDDARPAETVEAERIDELHGVLGQQGDALSSMKQVLEKLKQDPQTESIEALEEQLREVERRYREASTCIEIMQQENERLHERVDHRDYRIEQVEAEKAESVSELEEQLGRQKRNINELHDMIGDLQLEAEKAEQLQTKLDQFDLTTRDMNMCIQVLEEENQFLQEQIQALLQDSDSGTVYDKVAEEENEGGKLSEKAL